MVTKITFQRGDITRLPFDAIVNAANSALLPGGGVCGAIHRAGGPSIEAACRAVRAEEGDCPTGEAVMTTAGNLPARFVIHAVGPVYWKHDPEMPVLLGKCYRNALQLAVENGLKTIAFPNISTGIYGYPKEEACEVAIEATQKFIAEHDGMLEEVRFICFDEENNRLYSERLSVSAG